MSAGEWGAVVTVVAGLLLGLPLIRWFAKKIGASPEVARKTVHVAMGLACATFPWVFHRSLPVWVLAAIATGPLGLIRIFPSLRTGVGSALHGIDRPSYGEVLFAPAVAAVFSLANGGIYLYVIPILILTIADAAGALVGTRWGKLRYGSGEGFKTVEGSFIFWLTAFLCGFLPLLLGGRVDVMHALWIGVILGILAMMAEGISDRGFDNLVIPVGCFFLLDKLLTVEMPGLVWRFAVLVALLVLILVGSRWSTLSGGALLAGVILGYGCAVLADWRFALPLVAVFVCHLVTTRKHGLTGKFDHRMDAVLSHTIACMPWVIGVNLGVISISMGLAGLSFAMGTQLAILDTATRTWIPNIEAAPMRSVAKGFVIASLVGLVWLWPEYQRWLIPSAVALGCMWAAVLIFQMIHSRYRGHVTGLWIMEGLLSLGAPVAAFFIVS